MPQTDSTTSEIQPTENGTPVPLLLIEQITEAASGVFVRWPYRGSWAYGQIESVHDDGTLELDDGKTLKTNAKKPGAKVRMWRKGNGGEFVRTERLIAKGLPSLRLWNYTPKEVTELQEMPLTYGGYEREFSGLYFNIPLPNHPTLVELQNYLRRALPEGTEFIDPAFFHITLVYLETGSETDIALMPTPDHLPLFGVGAWGMTTFGTLENPALALSIESCAHLVYLQSDLYWKLAAMGMKVSAYSYPGAWRPHITLAYPPPQTRHDDDSESMSSNYISLPYAVHLEVNKFALTADDYVNLQTWELRKEVPVQEMATVGSVVAEQSAQAELMFEMVEMVKPGDAPDIPLPRSINLAALAKSLKKMDTSGNPDPSQLVFDTRPIGKVTTSRNGRVYSERSVESLVRQVNTNRPGGRWGHLREDELSTKYELPAVKWIAAVYNPLTKTAWAKMLALTADAEILIQTSSALETAVGTSIFAVEPTEDAGEIVDYRLISIDLADPARVGIPDMSTVPMPTSEMLAPNKLEETVMADENKALTEITVERDTLKTLTEQLQAKVSELETAAVATASKLTEFAAIGDLVGKEAGIVEAVKEMGEENTRLLETAIVAEIAEAVKLVDVQPVVRELVDMQKPTTSAQVKAAVQSVVDRPSIKALLKAAVAAEMGPVSQRNPKNPNNTLGEGWKAYVSIPEEK